MEIDRSFNKQKLPNRNKKLAELKGFLESQMVTK